MKVLEGTIEGRAREFRYTGDEGDPSSSQLLGIDGSDQVLLPFIQVGEQRGVFLLQFFFSTHTESIPRRVVLCNAYYFPGPLPSRVRSRRPLTGSSGGWGRAVR